MQRILCDVKWNPKNIFTGILTQDFRMDIIAVSDCQ
jgi:hypothetical protein